MSRRHWHPRRTLLALIAAIALPLMATEPMLATGEIQKPDTRPLGAIAGTSNATRAQTLNRILAAWRARQERVKSFHFSWDSRIALPKGYAFPLYWDNPVVGGLKDLGAEIGDQNVEFTIPQSEFWAEGKDRSRDDFFTVVYKDAKDWPQTARIRYIVDGTRISRLMTPVVAGELPVLSAWGQASVKNLSAFLSGAPGSRLDPRTVDWAALRLAFRPLDPAFGWSSPENCRVVGESVLVGGVRCIKIQMDEMDHSEMVWVDPSRDDIIVQWERREGRASPISVAIEYQHDKEHGWIPSRWKRQFPGKGETKGRIESTVTHYTINEKFPSEIFARTSSPGTRISDATADGLIPADKDAHSESAKQSAPAAPSIDAIIAAWTKRQAQTKSLKFTWREERESSARSAQGRLEQEPHTVLIEGERVAYVADNNPYPADVAPSIIEREEGKTKPDQKNARRVPQRVVPPARLAFDGAKTRTYRALNHPTLTGIGTTLTGFAMGEVQGVNPEPVLLMFRPFDPKLGRIHADDYHVSANRGKIGDVACVIIETSDEVPRRSRTSYWLDPARDYLVLRKQQTNNGRDFERMDISYRKDAAFGWVPDGFHASWVSDLGQTWRTSRSTFTDFALNQPIPPTEFLVEFPKGTKVHEVPNQPAQPAGGAGGVGMRLAQGPPRRAPRTSPRREPAVHFKPIYDPFANSVADVEAALKTAKESHKKVLVVVGDNSLPESLRLYPILKEDAEVAPLVDKGFVLVLVDLYSDAGTSVVERFFQMPYRITDPHVGVLDSNNEALQFQGTEWFHAEGGPGYDPHRIKRLLSYYLSPEK